MSIESVITGPDGFGAWFETFGRIQLPAPEPDPITGEMRFMVRPRANYLQTQFIRVVNHALTHELPIRIILLKPRQKGCSTVSVAFLYWMTRRLGLQSMIIGGKYKQTNDLWKILKRYQSYDTFPWASTGVVNEERGRYANGGEIAKQTAQDEEAGRGGTYQVVIVTELGRWQEGGVASAGDVLQGVQSTVHERPNTCVILESTARGNTGTFFEQWGDAIPAEQFLAGRYGPGIPFVRIFAPAHAFDDSRLPIPPDTLSHADRVTLERSLTDDERQRLAEFGAPLEYIAWRRHIYVTKCRRNDSRLKFDYPDTPEEAFHASSQTVFSSTAIRKMREAWRGFGATPGVIRAVNPEEPATAYALEPREMGISEVVIWDRPAEGLRYLVAVDPMTGVSSDDDGRNRDHHCALVLRAGYQDPHRGVWMPPKVVARTRPPTKDPEWNCQWPILTLEKIVFALSKYYGNCLTVVEANKDSGLIRGLWEMGCHLYSRDRTEDRAGEVIDPTSTEKLGFLTVGGRAENTRSAILEELEDAVARYGEPGQGIEIPDFRTLDEMEVFIWTAKGRKEAAPGEHDDSVMALAIAHHLRDWATTYREPRIAKPLPPELARLSPGARRRKAMYS